MQNRRALSYRSSGSQSQPPSWLTEIKSRLWFILLVFVVVIFSMDQYITNIVGRNSFSSNRTKHQGETKEDSASTGGVRNEGTYHDGIHFSVENVDEVDDETSDESEQNEIQEADKATSTVQNAKPSPPLNPLIHWNTTSSKSPPSLYFCHPNDNNGMREIKLLMASVLPEYTPKSLNFNLRRKIQVEELLEKEKYTNDYDVFVGHFDEYCVSPIVERWLHTSFNGHLVLFSGESNEAYPIPSSHASNRLHAFGPVKDDTMREEDMVLYYFQLTYLYYFRDVLPPNALVTSQDRPKGNSTKSTFMIYANSNCVKYREKAIGLLSEIDTVHCDGRCQGITPPSGNRTNLIKTKSSVNLGSWSRNVELFSNYKFCFVMEHTYDHTGYITEKIMLAFAGGCIPIYHGTKRIFNIFNKDAFVFYVGDHS